MVCKEDVRQSVLKTVAYADLYHSALTPKEIYLRLISDQPFSLSEVEGAIKELNRKGKLNIRKGRCSIGWVNSLESSDFRQKLNKANKDLAPLKRIPWLKFVGISGSVASHSSRKKDDIDVFLVTSFQRLWLTRLLIIILMKISGKKLRRYNSSFYEDYYCFNLFLSEPNLSLPQKKHNLFNAYQLYFIESVFDKENIKERLYLQNKSWLKKYLANFAKIATKDGGLIADKSISAKTRDAGFGRILDWIDCLAYKIQRLYMSKKLKREIVTRNWAFFHPKDNSRIISEKLN